MDLQLKEKVEDLPEKESLSWGFIVFCGSLIGINILLFVLANNIPQIAFITGLSIREAINKITLFYGIIGVFLVFSFFLALDYGNLKYILCLFANLGIFTLVFLYLVVIRPQVNIKQQLENAKDTLISIADTLITTASNEGHTDLDPLIQQLQNESNMDFTVDWSGTEYITGTKKVHLDRRIRLKLSMTIDLEGIPHTIDTTRSAKSNVDYSFEYEELKPTPAPSNDVAVETDIKKLVLMVILLMFAFATLFAALESLGDDAIIFFTLTIIIMVGIGVLFKSDFLMFL